MCTSRSTNIYCMQTPEQVVVDSLRVLARMTRDETNELWFVHNIHNWYWRYTTDVDACLLSKIDISDLPKYCKVPESSDGLILDCEYVSILSYRYVMKLIILVSIHKLLRRIIKVKSFFISNLYHKYYHIFNYPKVKFVSAKFFNLFIIYLLDVSNHSKSFVTKNGKRLFWKKKLYCEVNVFTHTILHLLFCPHENGR